VVTNLIQRIVNAQMRQEGAPPGALNPGNLRGAPWLTNPVIENGFWVPPSRQAGIAGLFHEVALHVAEGQSLTQYITGYAPPGDGNDTAAYIANVAAWAGIRDVNVPLWTYITIEE
jgi:hypothetical protein